MEISSSALGVIIPLPSAVPMTSEPESYSDAINSRADIDVIRSEGGAQRTCLEGSVVRWAKIAREEASSWHSLIWHALIPPSVDLAQGAVGPCRAVIAIDR